MASYRYPALIIGMLGNTVEKGITYLALQQGGVKEANPTVKILSSTLGLEIGLLLAYAIAGISMIVLYENTKREKVAKYQIWYFYGICALYATIALWNIGVYFLSSSRAFL